ncbi:membrane protein [Halolactibacillus alkaliphilus]|uniref:Membrane protein n=1 Tax=Halolactibacillus alkaliphilus TaxID=442899 RepID=A0A511X2A7_9BACI|nr:DUF624 domain-containing protein [Halolactibacillus alkaliphilus]GEN57085.1 membrane protein [Halolactibacillus alkaliphilus]GGN71859.1 membrane protein [Halolactibacillus alkaliphilus]SFO86991.1 Uncharacterized membrane protein YesL [Halolactibacillus alkaliphilus]
MHERLMQSVDWVSKLALLNLLWLLFTTLGLFVFGFFPATVAMFATIRSFFREDISLPLMPTFWQHFKENFVRSIGYGLLTSLITLLGIIDIIYIQEIAALQSLILHMPIYLFLIFSCLTLLYLFPVFVHYDWPFFQTIKQAFLIMLIHPIQTLIMVVSVGLSLYLMTYMPGIFFFFGGSFTALLISSITLHIFETIEERIKMRHASRNS